MHVRTRLFSPYSPILEVSKCVYVCVYIHTYIHTHTGLNPRFTRPDWMILNYVYIHTHTYTYRPRPAFCSSRLDDLELCIHTHTYTYRPRPAFCSSRLDDFDRTYCLAATRTPCSHDGFWQEVGTPVYVYIYIYVYMCVCVYFSMQAA